MKNETLHKNISVRLSKDEVITVSDYVKDNDTNVSALIRRLLIKYIEEQQNR
ncbi:ribbon-helix-helix protein, CopG family [Bacillus sp. sid0103]|uniref:DUF6290 family protein n=1 Tax=Bacillus sp. sid0103 TaxID=2856337 RepID=UPI001C494A57|nr:DUF6290 family protein [Bacillus sp. sid0103]MBV7504695.1 ribbon-helix-helix protein, CopG family [Bacillus sp. sid0103]